MKTLVEDRFDNIGAAITNSEEGIDQDLIDESKKRTYREIVRGDNNVEGDLDDDVIGKSIYVFSQIRYIKIKLIGDTSISANDITQSDDVDPILSSICYISLLLTFHYQEPNPS